MSSPIEFEFGWKALNLLGKTLYSNAWNAISELVANGFDAHAHNVYVRLDAIQAQNATIEILDDGDGMDVEGLGLYAKVGFNKRQYYAEQHGGHAAPVDIMGRKGIGKLAALYLSSQYYLATKTKNGDESVWKMEFKDNPSNENDKPKLFPTALPPVLLSDKWTKLSSGTLLRLQNVNLSGLSDRAYEALSVKLANCFSLLQSHNRKIHLCVRRKNSDPIDFHEAVKHVAFGNMAFIETSPYNSPDEQKRLSDYAGKELKIAYKKITSEQYVHHIGVENWGVETKGTFPEQSKEKGVEYVLTGWIGIHSTIKSANDDPEFMKNKYYNPNQLRLYVRNKLAMENFLNVINSTHTYSNYIEGEIHFDLLDDDSLPDIATSNRQGLDEHDERVALLQKLVNGIIHSLIKKRVDLAETMRKEEGELTTRRETTAKKRFASEIQHEFAQAGMAGSQKNRLVQMIVGKIKGDVVPKDQYQVFLSHASTEKPFSDFLYYLLLKQGAKKEELFYTSSEVNGAIDYNDMERLADKIKACIIDKNTLLVYFIGYGYKESEYCMFEGGAGWATRSVSEYPIVAIKHGHIPDFLTNGKNEFVLYGNGGIGMTQKSYQYLVGLLNKMIGHINGGREMRNETCIPLFAEPNIPDLVEMANQHKTLRDYMDKTILEYWDQYTVPHIASYLMAMAEKERQAAEKLIADKK